MGSQLVTKGIEMLHTLVNDVTGVEASFFVLIFTFCNTYLVPRNLLLYTTANRKC